ncbi:hypothetical protein SAMN04488556_2546 [Halostagnicola kamekurae]|uniref:DUF1850 domain-containing protein n=2 Tax=Halostagnicola kamekurae TaxID=619731 RepID=A0A1I6SBJ4_9EURY|nr:DUF1850 domain-containing protein [Halostagnicola kamekurae]SFS74316.1 hypothetical protein SAMN04488556_2546 [Halostagnicola kamekurae]
MHTLRRTLVALVVLAILVSTAALVVSASPSKTLVVTDADTGEMILETPVEDGENVTLAYTHSVEKTAVQDVYVVDDAELRTDRMVFRSHGAGLPSDADIELTDEGFVVSPNRSYETLPVVPGSIAGHELVVDGERYDLVERSDGPVRITVEDRTIGDRISGVLASIDRPHASLYEPALETPAHRPSAVDGPTIAELNAA